MNDRKAIFVALFGSILIAVCGVGLVFANSTNLLLELSTQTQLRDAVIQYIENNHPETVQFLADLPDWTGGKVETQLLGAETYTYKNHGWKVTIQYSIVPKPLYIITANYNVPSDGISIPYTVYWQGTFSNGILTEKDYTFAQ
jgi:hypothetical protein